MKILMRAGLRQRPEVENSSVTRIPGADATRLAIVLREGHAEEKGAT